MAARYDADAAKRISLDIIGGQYATRKIERIEPNGQFYEVYYADGYIFGATEAEVKQLTIGDVITVTTDDRNQVVRVVNNGRTVRAGVPAEFQ